MEKDLISNNDYSLKGLKRDDYSQSYIDISKFQHVNQSKKTQLPLSQF